MKRYNLSQIMSKAWQLFRKYALSFSEALKRAWAVAKAAPVNAQRIAEAKAAAGITEEVNTWAAWRDLLIHASKGEGKTYKASFFSASQVQPIEAAAA